MLVWSLLRFPTYGSGKVGTLEPMCVYEALYGAGGLWVRPAKMFFENVDKPGYSGPRFRIAGE